MKNVLLFADPGIDDSLALIYAILHPEINVVGVVASYGNVPKDQALQNVAYLLQLGNLHNIPIISGAEGPVSGELNIYYPEIHGEEGLGPIQPPTITSAEYTSFNEIFLLIEKYEHNLTIVDFGRNTSLSIAFILEPEMMSKVNEFYVMGGAFLVPGNVTPSAEANVYGDPLSSRNVLVKAKNMKLLPLNVTNYAFATLETASLIQSYSQNSYKDLIPQIIRYYNQAYDKLVPGIPGAPVHDLLTLTAMVNPTIFTFVERAVDVQLEGPARGLTIADFRPRSSLQIDKTRNSIEIAIKFNYNLFYQDFLSTMTRKIT